MTQDTKNNLAAVAMCIFLALCGALLSTEEIWGFLLTPIVTYFAGNSFAYLKKGGWSWKSGIYWGIIGAVASICFYLFGVLW